MTNNKNQSPFYSQLVQQLLPGLTVSFVAISLGAAFGVLSGRGALAGILSAGVIALITAAFGGTRIQCSGPTAPMTAVTILLVSAVGGGLLADHPDVDPDRFINLVLLLTGAMLIVASLLRLGRFIKLIPKAVISGFMNGIALLIWVGEFCSIFGIGGKTAYLGNVFVNLAIVLLTLLVIFTLPLLLRKISNRLNSFFPATLIAIVVVSTLSNLFGLDVQH
ncbi:MAG: SulP family inorganic anion transporter, partial [Pseudomonadota bacterium]